jgi:hypothetical protein
VRGWSLEGIFYLTGNLPHIDLTGSTIATRLSSSNNDNSNIIIVTGYRGSEAFIIRTSAAYHESEKTH